MADTLQQLLRERADQDTIAVKYGDRSWTRREHIAEATAQAATLIAAEHPKRPPHVGVLLDPQARADRPRYRPRRSDAVAADGYGVPAAQRSRRRLGGRRRASRP